MNQLKEFRLVLLSALLLAAALPVSAKPGPDDDCDGAGGDMEISGSLAVQGISRLNACTTQIEAAGTAIFTAREAGSGQATGRRSAEMSLTIVSTTIARPDGSSLTLRAVKGYVRLPKIIMDRDTGRTQQLEVSGIIDSSGQIIGVMEGKTGLNAIAQQDSIIMADIIGEVSVSEKEVVLKTKHHYTGHVTILK